ncbi:MAG: homoserine kinase [Anaerolineales bacterium]
MSETICVRVPATCANLGPGFDCLGLALDLWNEVRFSLTGEGFRYRVSGEGGAALNGQADTLLTQSFYRVYQRLGKEPPAGVLAQAENGIPLASGLGSSAAATIAGLMGVNALLGNPLTAGDLLRLATETEGHPDNAAPALLGGLVISAQLEAEIVTRRFEVPALRAVIVRPEVELLTRAARAVLPHSVLRADAVFNLSRVTLVVEALRDGDLDLLAKVMDDKLHQPYRLAHIPGGWAAYAAAKRFGAAALSGAGPSIIAFVPDSDAEAALGAMKAAFGEAGIGSRGFSTRPSSSGAALTISAEQ